MKYLAQYLRGYYASWLLQSAFSTSSLANSHRTYKNPSLEFQIQISQVYDKHPILTPASSGAVLDFLCHESGYFLHIVQIGFKYQFDEIISSNTHFCSGHPKFCMIAIMYSIVFSISPTSPRTVSMILFFLNHHCYPTHNRHSTNVPISWVF